MNPADENSHFSLGIRYECQKPPPPIHGQYSTCILRISGIHYPKVPIVKIHDLVGLKMNEATIPQLSQNVQKHLTVTDGWVLADEEFECFVV